MFFLIKFYKFYIYFPQTEVYVFICGHLSFNFVPPTGYDVRSFPRFLTPDWTILAGNMAGLWRNGEVNNKPADAERPIVN